MRLLLSYTTLVSLRLPDPGSRQRIQRGAVALAGAVTLQAGVGIVTILYQAPLALALTHQVLAILVLTTAVVHAERLSHRVAFSARRAKLAEQGA